jgi:hypothetical protein
MVATTEAPRVEERRRQEEEDEGRGWRGRDDEGDGMSCDEEVQ